MGAPGASDNEDSLGMSDANAFQILLAHRRWVHKDETSNVFVTRGALEMVGRFMASFYLRHWATYGALYKQDDVA